MRDLNPYMVTLIELEFKLQTRSSVENTKKIRVTRVRRISMSSPHLQGVHGPQD